MNRTIAVIALASLVASHVASGAVASHAHAANRARKPEPLPILVAQDGKLVPFAELKPAAAMPSPAAVTLATHVEQVLKTTLRPGITALYVADAATGQPIMALRDGMLMNPASNVKLIATAAILDLLGPDYQFETRLLGPVARPQPDVIEGDVYLLGSYDPTLDRSALREFADDLAAQGVKRITGDIAYGDAMRDGPYGLTLPITITANAKRNKPAAIALWVGDTDTVIVNKTKTVKRGKPRVRVVQTKVGPGKYKLTVSGTIPLGGRIERELAAGSRPHIAAKWLRWELGNAGIEVAGATRQVPIERFVADAGNRQQLIADLAMHRSASVATLVGKINKRSINWLADRLIAVAAGHQLNRAPSMAIGLDAMYRWLGAAAGISPQELTIDTGSGLSYATRIAPIHITKIIRAAAGFTGAENQAEVWRQSLSIGGTDGTLAHRFRSAQFAGRVIGKTGTLSNVIALSGLLLTNPNRPLVFAIVTNKHAPGYKQQIRRGHEQLVDYLTKYVVATDGVPLVPTISAGAPPAATPGLDLLDLLDDAEGESPTEPAAVE